jgi:glycosyltransferase involved in cell wall biosynthesis
MDHAMVGIGLMERRVLLREQPEGQASNRSLKILLGSVGSKSNKPAYLERIYGLLDRHPRLANMVLWTPATVHVSPLYAAADAYVMNAQGIGETFGRVTIEAMAFGLPVLGTDAGGTKEILESNVTGVLHPVGKVGIPVLARHLRWLLDHPDLGIQMGERGRERVSKMFREGPMYDKLARIFIDCVREQGG